MREQLQLLDPGAAAEPKPRVRRKRHGGAGWLPTQLAKQLDRWKRRTPLERMVDEACGVDGGERG